MPYMVANSKFNQNLEKWEPRSLKEGNGIFKDFPYPIPYWAQVHQEFIQQVITAYQLQQKLQTGVNSSLSIVKPNTKI